MANLKLKGCFATFFTGISIIVDFIQIIQWFLICIDNKSVNPEFRIFGLEVDPDLQYILLIYGLMGISILVWSDSAKKPIGQIKAWGLSFFVYLLCSSFFIFPYTYLFYHDSFYEFLISYNSLAFLIILPFITGRLLFEYVIIPARPN